MRFKFNVLYFLFVVGVGALIPYARKTLLHPEDYYGIAENQVRSINLQYPVEIRQIHVALGQQVDSGQLLATLYRTDLPLKINELTYEIKELDARRWIDVRQLKADLERLRAQEQEIRSEYTLKIRELEGEQNIQQSLFAELKSIERPKRETPQAANYTRQLEDLKARQDLDLQQLNLLIQQKEAQMQSAEQPVEITIAKLKNELELLKKQESELQLFAPQSGIIGQLDFQTGEKVSAYTVILKIYGQHPNVVTTYIADGRLAEIHMGQQLTVGSINNPAYQLTGTVVGLGTRVTLLPERLRRIPEIKIWGREVQLQIPAENEFLQGEKVKVNGLSAAY
ncbi:MAG: HlyD family efflux transporter periplasmic adaptor subunit [Chitinophagales bacterium]|nr:HlyD family efflux transporter periplasmic adaptor subunit [Chitinophagales bacterium]